LADVLYLLQQQQTCAARLRGRTSPHHHSPFNIPKTDHDHSHTGTSHPTIKNAEDGLSILARFASDLRLPTPDEGYDRIIRLTLGDQPLSPEYSHDQVAAILQRLRDSPLVTPGDLPSSRRGVGRNFPSNSRASVAGSSRGRGHTMRMLPASRRGIATTPSARGGRGRGRGHISEPVNTAAELPFSGIGDTAESVRIAAGNSDGIVCQRVAGEPSAAQGSNGQGITTSDKS
jgi:hypothetical protein